MASQTSSTEKTFFSPQNPLPTLPIEDSDSDTCQKIGRLVQRIFSSHLARLFTIMAATTLLAITFTAFLILCPYVVPAVLLATTLAIGVIASIGYGIYHHKHLLHEFSVIVNMCAHQLFPNQWAWWTRLDDHVILGALPLKNKGHLKTLVEQEKVSAFLSIIEDFEFEDLGIFHEAVLPEEWKKLQISHKQISVTDQTSPTLEQIEEGVSYIESQVAQGKTIYVHCKAGIGRSALIVLCYLLKSKRFLSVDEALAHLKQLRPQTLFIGANQVQTIHNYFNHLCNSQEEVI